MNVTLFEHINYEGASVVLSADTPDLRVKGAQWNDQASSVRVPAGATVTLYEHINYTGRSVVLTSDTPDLRVHPGPGADGTWNDAASSLKIAAAGSGTSERLKKGDKYVECNAGGTITLTSTKTDDGKVTVTEHPDKHFDATFSKAKKILTIDPNGNLSTRNEGDYGLWQQLDATTQPKPDEVNLIYRVNEGVVVGGTVLQIVEE